MRSLPLEVEFTGTRYSRALCRKLRSNRHVRRVIDDGG
jgi:hypothetical protein